jgi:hypothetical protein
MPPVVTKLKKNQMAIALGERLVPQGVPKMEVIPVSQKVYRLTFSIDLKAEVENLTGPDIDLPNGSFAVLDIAPTQPCTNFQVVTNCVKGTGSDFSLTMSILGDPPGSKGDHGN